MNTSLFNISPKAIKGRRAHPQIIKIAQNLIKKEFPPSFIAWLNLFGESVTINEGNGNFTTDMLLPQKKEEEISLIVYGAKELKKNQSLKIGERFIMGKNGEVYYSPNYYKTAMEVKV